MSVKPILFKPEMVRAILEGRKTQTRRVLKSPLPYAPGDLLWVREAWRTLHKNDCLAPKHLSPDHISKITYEADPENRNPLWAFGRLRPSIHMPRWASRITLEVTDVRVQRIQEISDADAFSEGVEHDRETATGGCFYGGCPEAFDDPATAFRHLWDSINASRGYGWEENPWVAAYTFKPHMMNVDDLLKERAA